MATYECPCGYVYDPAEGDYDSMTFPQIGFALNVGQKRNTLKR
jgi:rubredoxin